MFHSIPLPITMIFIITSTMLTAIIFTVEVSFFIFSNFFLEYILALMNHLKFAVENLHVRTRLELSAEFWPSDFQGNVFDIRYLTEFHNYIIQFVKKFMNARYFTMYFLTLYMRKLVMVSTLIARVISKVVEVESSPVFILIIGMQIFTLGTYCHHGTLITAKNVDINRMIQYKMANPGDGVDLDHPDLKSLSVLEARTSLDFSLDLDSNFPLKLNTSSLTRVFSFTVFILILFLTFGP
ncbi:Hypothetical predicted protein [Cloeon dipterum]|nr:Hypothetical predicted protein [Cloeon dipterum]